MAAKFKLKDNAVIILLIAALTLFFWALKNKPQIEPAWPSTVEGFSFSPMRMENNPIKGSYPTEDQIREDLRMLSKTTKTVRIYDVTEGNSRQVPRIAKEFGMEVTAGAWIGPDLARNENEIAQLIDLANNNDNVTRVLVGNEVVLRADLTAEGEVDDNLPEKEKTLTKQKITVDRLAQYMDRVREQVSVPVSTADTWANWDLHPELAEHADYVAVHILPYWEGIGLDGAVGHTVNRMEYMAQRFPGKHILLAEVGWPSQARQKGGAEASNANEAKFLRQFLAQAQDKHFDYFIMEAFDQPWKIELEGAAGAYWGVYDVYRNLKFPLKGPIVENPRWKTQAAISIALAILAMFIMLLDSDVLQARGRTFLGLVAFGSATALVWMMNEYSQQYNNWFTISLGILLSIGAFGVMIVLMVEAHELAEAAWARIRRRPFEPKQFSSDWKPKVSIHVPCYNEPPDMLKQTLDALAALDYPNFEVLVIDNNTKDPAVWQPVEEYCAVLGERFRFFHVAPLSGFKAGALNYALDRTAEDAEIIAVIDSDYIVTANWLADLVPHFEDPQIAIVQAPQDYRDGEENLYKSMCNAEYKGFFHIGMVTRNERNAIIQHGTMTMVRRTVLDRLRWGTGTITEDAELGLRVFSEGLLAGYIEKSYGQGLIPDTFIDFKKQRFRWAYGAIQIMRHHFAEIFLGKNTKLTLGQRYHFIGGWLPWLADGLNIFFTIGSLIWSVAMMINPQKVDPPMLIFALPPMALFFFKLFKLLFLYFDRVRATPFQTFAAAIAGLSLSHTISKAVIYGFITDSIPFFRTPKQANPHGIGMAIASAAEEIAIAFFLWGCAIGVYLRCDVTSSDVLMWIAVLIVQSQPYFFAMVMGFISTMKPRHQGTVPATA